VSNLFFHFFFLLLDFFLSISAVELGCLDGISLFSLLLFLSSCLSQFSRRNFEPGSPRNAKQGSLFFDLSFANGFRV
jgi:hypothetical protein